MYGGYTNGWERSATNQSTLTLTNPLPLGGSPTLQLMRLNAPSANSDQGTVAVTTENATARLEQVTISSGPGADATLLTPATNSVGLWAKSSTIQVVGGAISTGAGGAGAAGTPGTDGADGLAGLDGANGECLVGTASALGGAGGTSPVSGHDGGAGGLGGTITNPALAGVVSPDLIPGGAAGLIGLVGGIGQPGTPGTPGTPGVPGNVGDGEFGSDGFVPGDLDQRQQRRPAASAVAVAEAAAPSSPASCSAPATAVAAAVPAQHPEPPVRPAPAAAGPWPSSRTTPRSP